MEMEKTVLQLNLDDVLPNRFQPRIKFNEKAINELAESIKKHGVIQPIVVRPIGDKYEIIAGERRYKASVMAGNTTIPAIVANLDDRDSAEVALIENVQRQDLTPIEEAISYKKILDMGYLTQTQLAEKLGKEQSTIANKLRLLNLSEDVQEALLDEEISERHARSLLRLDSVEKQKEMLDQIVAGRLTVRKTDELIDAMVNKNNPTASTDLLPNVNSSVEVIDFGNINETIKEEPMINQNQPTDIVIPTEPVIETPVVDPGFVDVEKIETQAQDIFKQTPVANIQSLLEPMNGQGNVIPPVAKPEPIINNDFDPSPKKYFNIMGDDTPVVVTPTETPIEVFGGFNPQPIEEQPVVNETAITAAPVFTLPIEETPVVNNVEDSINKPFNFDNFNVSTPVVETPIAAAPYYEPEAVTEVEQPTEASTMAELKGTNTFVAGDMKTVINTIRTCSNTIEKYGFVIDTEEFDFEDMYQVIFKISKK